MAIINRFHRDMLFSALLNNKFNGTSFDENKLLPILFSAFLKTMFYQQEKEKIGYKIDGIHPSSNIKLVLSIENAA